MDSQKSDQPKSNSAIGIMALLALILIIIFYFRVGFIASFFICLIAWIIFFFVYFRFLFSIAISTQALVFLSIFALSVGFLIAANPKASSTSKSASGNSAATSNNAAGKFRLVKCASNPNDVPVMPNGYTNVIYSGAYSPGNTVGPEKANNIRTFSFKGQAEKKDKNTLYSYTARSGKDKDGNPLLITGDTVAMEACNEDNMTNWSYSVAEPKYDPAGSSVVSNLDYFTGGPHLTGPGTYRLDAYLKIGSGRWQLINRMTGITVTN